MANKNFYTNPAFCQQSEFYNPRIRALSPERRHPPVGAHKPHHSEMYYSGSPPRVGPKPGVRRSQSMKTRSPNSHQDGRGYEEMLVDDCIRQSDIHKYPDNMNGNGYVEREQESRSKHRYEYIPMQEQDLSPTRRQGTGPPGRVHRYAVIPSEERTEPKTRYALVPVEDLENGFVEVNKNRYEYIQDYYDAEPPISPIRMREPDRPIQASPNRVMSPQTPRKGNPIATQKLHELLITPRKNVVVSASKGVPLSPVHPPQRAPRAQKTLNYTLSTRQPVDPKRNTAVIAPICSSPVQSVYSETTFSNKTASWLNVSMPKAPVQATLAVAAIMMMLCGGTTSALCFYMVSVVGRMYYLDFGIISGFACLLLGMLGFRSRNCHWLPNRNFISGYIVLSAFSLLTCAGLLVLLFLQPKPGSPLADVTSGAVSGISGLSLFLASSGVVASFCCKYPPPDNRVQHCARGFTV